MLRRCVFLVWQRSHYHSFLHLISRVADKAWGKQRRIKKNVIQYFIFKVYCAWKNQYINFLRSYARYLPDFSLDAFWLFNVHWTWLARQWFYRKSFHFQASGTGTGVRMSLVGLYEILGKGTEILRSSQFTWNIAQKMSIVMPQEISSSFFCGLYQRGMRWCCR